MAKVILEEIRLYHSNVVPKYFFPVTNNPGPVRSCWGMVRNNLGVVLYHFFPVIFILNLIREN